ncbi:MAG: AAA family ATPase [Alphaproteobacteria bacterium]|nr:AAA family ATPase [Alphaproteobacteria bacterium]
MKFFKFFICFFISTSFYPASSYADPISDVNTAYPFENLFTHDLYRLDVANHYDTDPLDLKNRALFEKLFGETFAQMRINAQVNVQPTTDPTLQKLQQRKINKLIEAKIIPILTYVNELSTISWKDLGIKALRTTGTTFVSAYCSGGRNTDGEKIFNYKVAGGVMAAHVALEVGLTVFAEDGSHQKRIEAKALIATLLNKIENENIKDLEALYVESQSIYNDDWKEVIENKLIACRKAPGGLGNNDPLEALQDLLNFPTETISLPPNYKEGDELVEETNDFIKEIFAEETIHGNDQKLCFYKEDVKESLEQMVRDICDCSQNAIAEENGDKRKAYLFFGKPGAGKSVAAKLIAQALNLPTYYLDIANEDDFKTSSLYGSSSILSSNKGHFPKAFLAQNADGKRSKNIIIIIDDVDRAFTKDAATGKVLDMKGLMKCLLKNSDKETLYFDAGYYGIKKFDMSQVHLICTTNTDFSVGLDKEQFEALNSRFELIKFLPADIESKKKHIRDYLSDRKLKMSRIFYNKQNEWLIIRNTMADFIIDYYDVDDNRTVGQRIDALLQQPQDKWKETATKKKWAKTDIIVEAEIQAD